jgi:hypothetical protein
MSAALLLGLAGVERLRTARCRHRAVSTHKLVLEGSPRGSVMRPLFGQLPVSAWRLLAEGVDMNRRSARTDPLSQHSDTGRIR